MNSLLCLAVLGTVLGYGGAQPMPHECCSPAQYEGYSDGLTGYVEGAAIPTILWAQQRFHVDHTYKRIARFFELFEETTQQWRHIEIVENFDTKRRYMVESGACRIENITTEMMSQCVHSDAAHTHEFHIGGPNGLMVNSWRLPVENAQYSRYLRTIMAPPEHCHVYEYLAMYASTSAESRSWSDFVSYNRITEGIEDTTVFEVPSECHHGRRQDLPPVVKSMLEAFYQ